MQTERKRVKQSQKKKNKRAIKQRRGPLVPPQGQWIIFWAMSFELFCRTWNPHQVDKLSSTHKHVDVRPVGSRGWWRWPLLPSLPASQKSLELITPCPCTLALFQARALSPRHEPTRAPSAWQVNKGIFFYFTQNSVSISIQHRWTGWISATFLHNISRLFSCIFAEIPGSLCGYASGMDRSQCQPHRRERKVGEGWENLRCGSSQAGLSSGHTRRGAPKAA